MNTETTEWTADFYTANESECNILLERSDVFRQIPCLNALSLDELKHGQLVRFRGMIQDMYDPEYYFRQYSVKNIDTGETRMCRGSYMDSAECLNNESERIDADSENNEIAERHTCVVISIPGLNEWAKEKRKDRGKEWKTSRESAKRDLSAEESMDCSEPRRKKEKIDFETCVATGGKKRAILSVEHAMNFPIPIDDGKACIVKVYEDKNNYKLNEIVDVVGFLSLDRLIDGIEDDTIDDLEIQTHNPPANLVPRLHAIKIMVESNERPDGILPSLDNRAESIRGDLRMVLGQLLFGDCVAADYLICHLISAVYMRKDHLCLGSLPLNITNFPISKYKTFAKDLYRVISTLVPKSHYLEITLDYLNDTNLIPKKDYDCNRLTSGILQLSKNTHLVIDETGLTSGQVSAMGKKNYEAVSDMIKFQKVNYDFKYFTIEYETDIPVLILSEVKSFIPCATQIALKIDDETEKLYPSVREAASQYLRDEERLANIRDYLRALRNAEFEYSEDITSVIQNDFVKLRQRMKNFGADNLHSLMVLARLMSLSRGFNSLSLDCWRETLEMELERIGRISARKTPV